MGGPKILSVLFSKKVIMIDLEQYIINRVTNFRLRMQLTQAAMAKIINVSSSFVGNVENIKSPAKYNLKHLSLLAGRYHLNPVYFLVSDADYMKIYKKPQLKELFPGPKYQVSREGADPKTLLCDLLQSQ